MRGRSSAARGTGSAGAETGTTAGSGLRTRRVTGFLLDAQLRNSASPQYNTRRASRHLSSTLTPLENAWLVYVLLSLSGNTIFGQYLGLRQKINCLLNLLVYLKGDPVTLPIAFKDQEEEFLF
jgi:hypothetical protein